MTGDDVYDSLRDDEVRKPMMHSCTKLCTYREDI